MAFKPYILKVFRECWVKQLFLGVLNERRLIEALNSTKLALIPKKKNLEIVAAYRPISLCNIIYK